MSQQYTLSGTSAALSPGDTVCRVLAAVDDVVTLATTQAVFAAGGVRGIVGTASKSFNRRDVISADIVLTVTMGSRSFLD